MRRLILFVLLFCFSFSQAQTPPKLNSSEIYAAIEKLNFLGSVLYVAAHPDDENTRLISYFANEVNARTAYLSITRGDGGQNLIGPQLQEQLGIIRTQELLAARRIDGGEQIFTRANDFGYTKTAEEALEFWEKEEVLGDVVFAIRKFRPDVIINRFDPESSGETHGQHTASAILSVEAFALAGDKTAFPDQLKFVQPFKPERLYFNTSPWFYESEEAFEKADKTNFLSFDTGTYFPLKGLSNSEISALSRSQHQSQGFGSTGYRGRQVEYLEIIKGSMPENSASVFEGINTSWSRVKGGAEIGEILKEVQENYNFKVPAASVPKLVEAYQKIMQLQDPYWKKIKSEEIKNIIASAAGLYLEVLAQTPTATPSEEIEVSLEAINRSSVPMILNSVELEPNDAFLKPEVVLEDNLGWEMETRLKLPAGASYSSPYWLRSKGSSSIGMYEVEDKELIGLPETPEKIRAVFTIEINKVKIPFEKNLVYKFNDAVKGEVYRPFEILPPVWARINEEVIIFADETAKRIPVTITAEKENVSGTTSLIASEGWKITPEITNFKLSGKGESQTFYFEVKPPAKADETNLKVKITSEGKSFSQEVVRIDYEHIPLQTLTIPAESKLVKLVISKKGQNIGYIEGAGDVVPESLEQIGYNVTTIDPQKISHNTLSQFDAVVLGIRAYNTVEELQFQQKELLEYVNNGGTLVVQYNVNRSLLAEPIAPYELNISRERVTEEDAEVRFLAPEHPVLNTPNKITEEDFEGWVQERGLYFPDSWGPEFTPIFSMNDENETPKDGSLLIAKYGKGHFVYTGISFFRQFPEGVPGAFRLFANLVSLGK